MSTTKKAITGVKARIRLKLLRSQDRKDQERAITIDRAIKIRAKPRWEG
jgi:hypothetical protein